MSFYKFFRLVFCRKSPKASTSASGIDVLIVQHNSAKRRGITSQPMGHEKLNNDMQVMNDILLNTADESILKTKETKNRVIVILLKLYTELANLLHFIEPSLVEAVSLQMVDLTLKPGLTSVCPLAFTFYGGILASTRMDILQSFLITYLIFGRVLYSFSQCSFFHDLPFESL